MAQKKRRGRPKLPEPKDHQFNFRVSESEYKLIQQAARGYPVTTWARVELLRVARDALILSVGERTGNIWLAELREEY